MANYSPTLYPDVNELLHLLLSEATSVLDEQFVGMYLYGSLAGGGFNPESSDIDFLIVTRDTLDEPTIARLETMHRRIWNSGLKWSAKLEGSYLPRGHLPRYQKSAIAYPTVNEGNFYLAPHDSDWIIQRHIIREQGVTLAGPDPKSLIDPVGPQAIRGAVLGYLHGWWFPLLEDLPYLKNRGSAYYAYAVLSMCRSLHALEHGTVVSKTAAAAWAHSEFGDCWCPAIARALAGQVGQEEYALFEDAVAFIQFTLERVSRM